MKNHINFSFFLLFLSMIFGRGLMAQSYNSSPLEIEIIPYSVECITPPEGFMIRDGFNGYMHFGTKSSIVIFKLTNRTIVDAEEAMNDAYFESNKITLISKKEITTNNGEEGLLYKFSYNLKGEEQIRYSLYLGDLNSVLWINFNYPLKNERVVEKEAIRSLLTVRYKN
jgi:hypothetical protein